MPRSRLLFAPILLTLGVCASPLEAGIVLDRQGAVNAVVTQLGLTGFTEAWCPYVDYGFGHRGLLPAGTVVRPEYAGDFPHTGNAVTLTCPMYVFLVDPLPVGLYTHEVQFVFVDATVAFPNLFDGTIHVETQGWWPVIRRFQLEESFFGPNGRFSSLPAGPNNPDGLVYEGAPPPSPPLLYEEPNSLALLPEAADYSKACVIVATGIDSLAGEAEKALTGSAKTFKQELINRGVPPGRAFTRLRASKQDLRNVIKASCATSVNPPCEKIYFYMGSHGAQDSLLLRDGWTTADTLCSIFKKLGAKKVPVCLMIESCKSGSLIDNLRPKLPQGVIITVADSLHQGFGGKVGNSVIGYYMYAFLQCWKDPAADSTPGVGNGNGTVEWNEAFKWVCKPGKGIVASWDVKTSNPAMVGLPRKSEKKNTPGIGWVSTLWIDWDKNGAYDFCQWRLDEDCDGTAEYYYDDLIFDEDGKTDRVHAYRDENDDGAPETRYDIVDSNNDGTPDSLSCSEWTGIDWLLNASIVRRSVDSYQIAPASGSEHGGQNFTLNATSTFWSNPNVKVFIGSQATGVIWLSPTQIQGKTTGYFEGPRDVIVADFDPLSPSFGFDLLRDGYTYTPEMAVEGVDPPHAWCGSAGTVTVSGRNFDPGAQIRFDGIALPTAWVDAQTLSAMVPPCVNLGSVQVSVGNPDLESAFLDSAFTFLPAPDVTPPVIGCPPELYLDPGADGLARTPTEWTASALDETGYAAVARSTLGALAGGTHQIRFDAVDGSGNRSSCTALVHVSGSSTVPTTRPVAFALGSPYPNPFLAATSIRFALPEAVPVRLRVFSLAGQLVATLADRLYEPGEYDVSWSGLSNGGDYASNGVYFLHLEAGEFQATRRVTLIR